MNYTVVSVVVFNDEQKRGLWINTEIVAKLDFMHSLAVF